MNKIILSVLILMAIIIGIVAYNYNSKINGIKNGVLMVIDDETIESGDVFEIIQPLWWNVSIYDGEQIYIEDLKNFSVEQKYVFAIIWYQAEVNNGGHDQFYFNSTGIVWEDAIEGFKQIGLKSYYDILNESVNRFNNPPSKDRFSRQEQMDSLEVGFEDLDTRFYQNNINIEEELLDYIKENRDKFYFKGNVKIPEEYYN